MRPVLGKTKPKKRGRHLSVKGLPIYESDEACGSMGFSTPDAQKARVFFGPILAAGVP